MDQIIASPSGQIKHTAVREKANEIVADHVNVITGNPHSVSANDVGLGNVDNTSDENKPVSTAQQTALDEKQATLVSGTNIKTINGSSILGSGNLEIDSGSQVYVDVVKDFNADNTGATDTTTQINNAIASLASGDTLYFPKGDYLVAPGINITTANIYVLFQEGAKLVTAETALYNYILGLRADGIIADGIEIDTTGDVAQQPTGGGSTGCHSIFANNFNNITIKNSKVTTYGATGILVQPSDGEATGATIIDNNEVHFERRVATYYDCTAINVESANLLIATNNKVYTTDGSVATDWTIESAYEFHAPRIISTNNVADNCTNGILLVSYPLLYSTYDTDAKHGWIITDNTISGAVRGIVAWGTHQVSGTVIKNFIINNNSINLYADSAYSPVLGIGFHNGGIDGDTISDGTISKNVIETTYASGLNKDQILSGVESSNEYGGVGAIGFCTSNSCKDIVVSDNTINSFPGPAINIIARQDSGVNLHERIVVHNNVFKDTNFSTYFDLSNVGMITVEYAKDVFIEKNMFIRDIIGAKGLITCGNNIENIAIKDNKYYGYENYGFQYGLQTGSSFDEVFTDNEIMLEYGATRYNNVLNWDKSPTTEKTFIVGEVINDSGTIKACTVDGSIRSSIGTLTAAYGEVTSGITRVYIVETGEVKVGDFLTFTLGESAMCVYINGNDHYFYGSLTSWVSTINPTLTTPTFA